MNIWVWSLEGQHWAFLSLSQESPQTPDSFVKLVTLISNVPEVLRLKLMALDTHNDGLLSVDGFRIDLRREGRQILKHYFCTLPWLLCLTGKVVKTDILYHSVKKKALQLCFSSWPAEFFFPCLSHLLLDVDKPKNAFTDRIRQSSHLTCNIDYLNSHACLSSQKES